MPTQTDLGTLGAKVMQRTVEGDCEPMFWQGIKIGHVTKFDSRLQIEVVRALMPATFKTPGQSQVNIDTGDKVLVLDEETRARLIEKPRQALAFMPKSTDAQTSHSGTHT